MKVTNHNEKSWFLFENESSLLLDVNCSHSYFDYSWMIELNENERKNYEEEGTNYLDRLAESIRNSVPIHKESTSPFAKRDVSKIYGKESIQAFESWNKYKL